MYSTQQPKTNSLERDFSILYGVLVQIKQELSPDQTERTCFFDVFNPEQAVVHLRDMSTEQYIRIFCQATMDPQEAKQEKDGIDTVEKITEFVYSKSESLILEAQAAYEALGKVKDSSRPLFKRKERRANSIHTAATNFLTALSQLISLHLFCMNSQVQNAIKETEKTSSQERVEILSYIGGYGDEVLDLGTENAYSGALPQLRYYCDVVVEREETGTQPLFAEIRPKQESQWHWPDQPEGKEEEEEEEEVDGNGKSNAFQVIRERVEIRRADKKARGGVTHESVLAAISTFNGQKSQDNYLKMIREVSWYYATEPNPKPEIKSEFWRLEGIASGSEDGAINIYDAAKRLIDDHSPLPDYGSQPPFLQDLIAIDCLISSFGHDHQFVKTISARYLHKIINEFNYGDYEGKRTDVYQKIAASIPEGDEQRGIKHAYRVFLSITEPTSERGKEAIKRLKEKVPEKTLISASSEVQPTDSHHPFLTMIEHLLLLTDLPTDLSTDLPTDSWLTSQQKKMLFGEVKRLCQYALSSSMRDEYEYEERIGQLLVTCRIHEILSLINPEEDDATQVIVATLELEYEAYSRSEKVLPSFEYLPIILQRIEDVHEQWKTINSLSLQLINQEDSHGTNVEAIFNQLLDLAGEYLKGSQEKGAKVACAIARFCHLYYSKQLSQQDSTSHQVEEEEKEKEEEEESDKAPLLSSTHEHTPVDLSPQIVSESLSIPEKTEQSLSLTLSSAIQTRDPKIQAREIFQCLLRNPPSNAQSLSLLEEIKGLGILSEVTLNYISGELGLVEEPATKDIQYYRGKLGSIAVDQTTAYILAYQIASYVATQGGINNDAEEAKALYYAIVRCRVVEIEEDLLEPLIECFNQYEKNSSGSIWDLIFPRAHQQEIEEEEEGISDPSTDDLRREYAQLSWYHQNQRWYTLHDRPNRILNWLTQECAPEIVIALAKAKATWPWLTITPAESIPNELIRALATQVESASRSPHSSPSSSSISTSEVLVDHIATLLLEVQARMQVEVEDMDGDEVKDESHTRAPTETFQISIEEETIKKMVDKIRKANPRLLARLTSQIFTTKTPLGDTQQPQAPIQHLASSSQDPVEEGIGLIAELLSFVETEFNKKFIATAIKLSLFEISESYCLTYSYAGDEDSQPDDILLLVAEKLKQKKKPISEEEYLAYSQNRGARDKMNYLQEISIESFRQEEQRGNKANALSPRNIFDILVAMKGYNEYATIPDLTGNIAANKEKVRRMGKLWISLLRKKPDTHQLIKRHKEALNQIVEVLERKEPHLGNQYTNRRFLLKFELPLLISIIKFAEEGYLKKDIGELCRLLYKICKTQSGEVREVMQQNKHYLYGKILENDFTNEELGTLLQLAQQELDEERETLKQLTPSSSSPSSSTHKEKEGVIERIRDRALGADECRHVNRSELKHFRMQMPETITYDSDESDEEKESEIASITSSHITSTETSYRPQPLPVMTILKRYIELLGNAPSEEKKKTSSIFSMFSSSSSQKQMLAPQENLEQALEILKAIIQSSGTSEETKSQIENMLKFMLNDQEVSDSTKETIRAKIADLIRSGEDEKHEEFIC